MISIHAPLTGSDHRLRFLAQPWMYFNPRSPYGERPFAPITAFHCGRFQSTLPLRGATGGKMGLTPPIEISIHAPLTGSDQGGTRCVCRPVYFNPRSPYGERQHYKKITQKCENFNPRSPYGERHPEQRPAPFQLGFQSTLPLRGATRFSLCLSFFDQISIHAPLTGSDFLTGLEAVCNAYFNPRSPYGERPGETPIIHM